MERGMRIGELAERAGTTTRTLRYYESRGLLSVRRDARGYRTFGEEDLRLLRQIRTLRDSGFDLEETRPFVECLRAGHPEGDSCPDSLDVYRDKLAELDACIGELRTVRDGVRERLARAEVEAAARSRPAPEPRCELTPRAKRPTQAEQPHVPDGDNSWHTPRTAPRRDR